MKILITGAGGFIGSHLCETLLERGYSVRAFVRYNSLGSWGWLDTSAQGTYNVLQACLELGVDRIIYTSTSEVYGTAREVR